MTRFVEIGSGSLALREGATVDLGPGEARVAVLACGICGTDQHLLEGMVLPLGASYPVRPGHEVAGRVVEVAQDVSSPSVGDHVVLHPLDPCGSCRHCATGAEQRCRQRRVLGLDAFGGMADEVVWPARRMVRSGSLDPQAAALLPDAVATAHHALMSLDLTRISSLAVIGAGGVGTHVLKLAQTLAPHIELSAIVRSAATAERTRGLGVRVYEGLEGAGRRLKQERGPVDAVLDFSGSAAAPREAIRALADGGVLVLGSIIDHPADFGTTMTGLVTREIEVRGTYSSSIEDLRAVVALAVAGRLDLDKDASRFYALDNVGEAFAALVDRPPGSVRLVVVP